MTKKGVALVMDNLVQDFTFNPEILKNPRKLPHTSLFEVVETVAVANMLFPPEDDFGGWRWRYEERYANVV